jgi:hypothetical protein
MEYVGPSGVKQGLLFIQYNHGMGFRFRCQEEADNPPQNCGYSCGCVCVCVCVCACVRACVFVHKSIVGATCAVL